MLKATKSPSCLPPAWIWSRTSCPASCVFFSLHIDPSHQSPLTNSFLLAFCPVRMFNSETSSWQPCCVITVMDFDLFRYSQWLLLLVGDFSFSIDQGMPSFYWQYISCQTQWGQDCSVWMNISDLQETYSFSWYVNRSFSLKSPWWELVSMPAFIH